ncbi:hypothetical protein GALMADRAFT_148646 [Galerina marginata CBS 339.88]|uniref:Uncharacterized protein n=1 Tax=Galerina marginata (strain CBS 339.88) TaxID=685588 RepID=A0A067S3Z5_GALM3|nr:hypothetical protein GALMADRAFT_148646 [Galerina marginata CBS 339.88]
MPLPSARGPRASAAARRTPASSSSSPLRNAADDVSGCSARLTNDSDFGNLDGYHSPGDCARAFIKRMRVCWIGGTGSRSRLGLMGRCRRRAACGVRKEEALWTRRGPLHKQTFLKPGAHPRFFVVRILSTGSHQPSCSPHHAPPRPAQAPISATPAQQAVDDDNHVTR